MKRSEVSEWAVIGAGPAGLASVGLLLDSGVSAGDIAWVDPAFTVGDFGRCWGEVNSNTTVQFFLDFLQEIKAFEYDKRPAPFFLDTLSASGFTQLRHVTDPMQWITDHLRNKVSARLGFVESMQVENGCWSLCAGGEKILAKKVILATGAQAKSFDQPEVEKTPLEIALKPSRLEEAVDDCDSVAVFGSSHSAMIIIQNLLRAGARKVVNFYLSPIRYAVPMGDYTLYDNTGLKGETAKWVRKNISESLHSRVERHHSTPANIEQYLGDCNKAIYAVGFAPRFPELGDIDPSKYDSSCGIIAPGLFGTGIAFPKQVVDPNGCRELSVGLWKFMRDLRAMLPVWMKYGL